MDPSAERVIYISQSTVSSSCGTDLPPKNNPRIHTEHSGLEAGYAGEFNHGDYNFNVSYLDLNQQAFVTDIEKTSRFIFDEAIHALYATYRLTPQGESRPSYVVNVGARQDLLDEKLSLSITVADLFHTLKRQLELNTPMLNQTVINRRDSGIVYLGLTYHFGTETKKTKEDQLRYDDGI